MSSAESNIKLKGQMNSIFAINPAPIASQLSINVGDHKELKILLQICIIASRINQKLRNKGGYIVFLKENVARFLRPFDLVGL